MIDEKFKEVMESKTGCAIIMAGSDSDKDHILKITKELDGYGIPYKVRICSAHKQADTLIGIIKEYNEVDGLVTYIAVAGGTDALSGTLSYHALGPVISCSPDVPNQSCLTNPPGSSNAYIVRPSNVAKFIAQMYAGINPHLKQKLETKNQEKIKELLKADSEFEINYFGG